MAVTTTTAIASGTTAATSSDITVDAGSSIQVWTDIPLAEGESVSVYRTDDGGTEEVRVREAGLYVMLTKYKSFVALNGPATFRLKRSVVATATAVFYDA